MSADPADPVDPAARSRRRRSRYLAAPPKPGGAGAVEGEPPLTYDPASMRARMRAGLKRPARGGEDD